MESEIFNISGEWQNDLLWCPSQCYLEIWVEDTPFVIYLRWRSYDPWTLSLIEGTTLSGFIIDGLGCWTEIYDFPPFSESDDLNLIQKTAVEYIEKHLSSPRIVDQSH